MSNTATRVPIPPSDQTWLHMDRDNNLMHVHSLMWYAGEPSFAAVRGILEDRVIGRFPVFRRRPVEVDGQWMWEDDPDFDLKHHLRRVKLRGAGGVDELRDHVSERFSAGFAPGRPLWDMEVIRGVTGLDDEPVTVTFSRFHHALADGIRLVQMMLSLCDSTGEDVLPPDVGRAGSGGVVTAGLGVARRGASDAIDLAKGIGVGALRLPLAVTHLRPTSFEHGLDLMLHPAGCWTRRPRSARSTTSRSTPSPS
jgi:diacylglycerol O-acyltransferase / wax synthase